VNELSYFTIGDSITEGGDDSFDGDGLNGRGWWQRVSGLEDGAVASFNMSMGGAKASQFIDASHTYYREFFKYADVLVDSTGRNDILTNGDATYAEVRDNITALWAIAKNATDSAISYIIRPELLVDTSSTDDWATTANQTKNTGWTDGGVADQIDDYFATKKLDGTLDHVFTTNRLKDDGDSNLWKVDGTADKYTDDGTHPSEAGHVLYAQDALDGIREFNVIVNGAVAPYAPQSLVATPASGQVALTWDAPTYDGGAAISDYIVQYKLSASGTWLTFADGTSASTGATVTGLTNDSAYDFRIAAVNSEGTGATTATVSSTPAVVGYSPATDSSTVGWYDFSDAASITESSGNIASVGNQRSGGSSLGDMDVTAASAGFTYDSANDRGVLTGSEDDILIANTLPHFFAVIEADSSFDESTAIGRPFAHEPTTGDDMTVRLGPFSGSLTDEVMGITYATYAAGATSANVSGVTAGNKFIIGVSAVSGSDPLLFLNTTASQTDDTVGDNTDPTIGTGDLRIGSGIGGFGNFVGKIYELIVLDGAPTAQEAEDIVDYLATEHSVSVT